MIRSASGSLRDETGIAAGGRVPLVAGWAAAAGLTGAATRSAGFNSVDRTSGGFNPDGFSAASAGRGRGNSGMDTATGPLTALPNIGDGWRPACMNTAFAMMALTAANAAADTTKSFGLYNRMRSAKLRCSLSIVAA